MQTSKHSGSLSDMRMAEKICEECGKCYAAASNAQKVCVNCRPMRRKRIHDESQRRRNMEAAANGRCRQCGLPNDRLPRQLCTFCAQKQNARQRAYYLRKRIAEPAR